MKIGFISDIHEDEIRLKQAIGILESCCDKIVCLGDIIGYSVPFFGFLKSRDAHGCVQLVKEHCDIAVAGNHDLAAIGKLPAHVGGIHYPMDYYRMEPLRRAALAKKLGVYSYENDLPAVVSKEDVRFLRGLPEYTVERFDGIPVLISHYAYPDITGCRDQDIIDPKGAMPQIGFQMKNRCGFGISGHDHVEGLRIFDNKKVRNIRFGVSAKITCNDWISCPCVANGTFANGIAILDTDRLEMTAIALKTKRHAKQSWRLR